MRRTDALSPITCRERVIYNGTPCTLEDHKNYPTYAVPPSRHGVFLDDGSAKLLRITHGQTYPYEPFKRFGTRYLVVEASILVLY